MRIKAFRDFLNRIWKEVLEIHINHKLVIVYPDRIEEIS